MARENAEDQPSLFSESPFPIDGATLEPNEPEAEAAAEEPEPEPEPEPDPRDSLIEQQSRALETLLAARTAAPAAPVADASPTHPGTMPNPIEEPDDYTEWVTNMEAYRDHRVDTGLNEARRDLQDQALRERLWTSFSTEHPDLAQDTELVSVAWRSEVQRNGGVVPPDVNERIATRLRSLGGNSSASTAPAEANRTAGVSSESSPPRAKPKRGKGSEDDEVVPFDRQLADLQLKQTGDFF